MHIYLHPGTSVHGCARASLAPLSFAVLKHAKAGISIIILLSNSYIFGALPQEMKIKVSIRPYDKQRQGIKITPQILYVFNNTSKIFTQSESNCSHLKVVRAAK